MSERLTGENMHPEEYAEYPPKFTKPVATAERRIYPQTENLTGRAFLCDDGLVRWVTHRSVRNYYSLLWREQDSDLWHNGGIIRADRQFIGIEVDPPQERYRIAGSTGIISERIAVYAKPQAEQTCDSNDFCTCT